MQTARSKRSMFTFFAAQRSPNANPICVPTGKIENIHVDKALMDFRLKYGYARFFLFTEYYSIQWISFQRLRAVCGGYREWSVLTRAIVIATATVTRLDIK